MGVCWGLDDFGWFLESFSWRKRSGGMYVSQKHLLLEENLL